MARKAIWVDAGAASLRSIKGLDRLQKMIAALPDDILREVAPAVDKFANRVCDLAKQVCPVNDLEAHPGALKASGHVADAESPTGIAKAVIFDAQDAQGRFIGAHVEHGHKARDGSHVPPVPFLWPAYNHEKKAGRSAVARAMSKAVKARAGDGQ